MATSFISRDNKVGFWIHDSLFQIVCSLISKTISSKQSNNWINDINGLFTDNAKGLFPGFMHLDFENVLNNEERINYLLNIIDDLEIYLLEKGEFISVSELNSFISNPTLQNEWYSPLEIKRLLRVLKSLKALLQNKMDSQLNNPWFDDLHNDIRM